MTLFGCFYCLYSTLTICHCLLCNIFILLFIIFWLCSLFDVVLLFVNGFIPLASVILNPKLNLSNLMFLKKKYEYYSGKFYSSISQIVVRC